MDIIKKYRVLIVFVIALLLVVGVACLRIKNLIESGDFSLLVIAIMIGSFVIIFFEKISEVSIAGNTVKLERINEKSEELLKQLRIEHLKLRIESVFGATNFFGGGDSISTCRTKLYEVANAIKEAELLGNEELKNTILPLLIRHSDLQLNHVRQYGDGLEVNPIKSLVDPQEIREAISDELVGSARISSGSNNVSKLLVILENIEIYQNLLKAKKWFD